MRRDDGVLPTIVAYATMPLVLADGELLAPEGLDRKRGIQFLIPDELRAVIPKRGGLHARARQGGDGVPVRRVAGRRRHRLRPARRPHRRWR